LAKDNSDKKTVDKSISRAYYNGTTINGSAVFPLYNKPLEQVPHDKGSASSKGF
jgi:hypothetical protein